MLLLPVILVFALLCNNANITVMNLLTKLYTSKPKLPSLVTVPEKVKFTEHIINRRHVKPVITTPEPANKSLKVSTNNLKEFYLKKFLKYFAPEYDLVTVSPCLKTTATFINTTGILGNNVTMIKVKNIIDTTWADEITSQREFYDNSSELYSTSFESLANLTLNHNRNTNHNLTTNVTVLNFCSVSKTPSTNVSYFRRVQKVMKSLWTPYPMRTKNMTSNHHFNSKRKNVTKENKLKKELYSFKMVFDNSTLKSNKKHTSRVDKICMTESYQVTLNHSTLKTTKLLKSDISETVVVPSLFGVTLDIKSSIQNSTVILTTGQNTSLYTTIKPEATTLAGVFDVSMPPTSTENESVFRKLFPFLFKEKPTISQNNIVNTNSPVLLTHNTSLIYNHSYPALMIMNDTHVSVLSNESYISAETLTKASKTTIMYFGIVYIRYNPVFTIMNSCVCDCTLCFLILYIPSEVMFILRSMNLVPLWCLFYVYVGVGYSCLSSS